MSGPAAAWAIPANEAANSPPDKLDLSANSGNSAARKNYYIPAVEIDGFEAMLNLVNWYDSSGDRLKPVAGEIAAAPTLTQQGRRIAAVPMRVNRRHVISIKYLGNRRDASFADQGTVTQSRATIGIFYTYLGQGGFGKVDWR